MRIRPLTPTVLSLVLTAAFTALASGDDKPADGWVTLVGPAGHELDAWKTSTKGWETVSDVEINPSDVKKLVAKPGDGVIFNGVSGRAGNLVSKAEFGDVEVHLEFAVPKGSNSGIKLEGVYEIQIFDSYGVKKPRASDCGGVYPRAELLPKYHHIDEGYPPKKNACKPPGEWQTLDITFIAPKVDAKGEKTANARFAKVVLNGEVVHEDLEVPYPTGHNWHNKDVPRGPIFLQGDHGPVAFRNVKARPLTGK